MTRDMALGAEMRGVEGGVGQEAGGSEPESAGGAVFGVWQAIETAPEETDVLVWTQWGDTQWGEYWVVSQREGVWETDYGVLIKPTHWMPLPKAPGPPGA